MRNPWANISPPSDNQTINARRVDDVHPWDFYWAVDQDRRHLLILRSGAALSQRLPRLRGLEVTVQDGESEPQPFLMIRLLDPQLHDVFVRLCDDIVSHAFHSVTEAEALSTSVMRLWKWHHLLRGGTGGLLSANEQRGLIGELLFMEAYLLDILDAARVTEAWRGPLHAPQDFVLGELAIECKANAGPTASRVRISSEQQLSLGSLDRLFLHTCILDPADGDSPESFTLNEIASRVQGRMAASGQDATERYESLLMAAGFDFGDDYTGYRWSGGERSIHEVSDSFPRLTPGELPNGISDLKYSVDLSMCAPFLTTPAKLKQAIEATYAE